MKKIYLLLSIMALSGVAITSSAQVMVNGVTPYTDLTSAFAAINGGTHTGAITIDISANTTEPGVARLNRGDVLPANYSSVDIHVTNDNVVVSGPGTAVIELRGADNVTLDGDNANTPGVNRNLTIRNTSLGGNNVGIWITSSTAGGANGATLNLITNCIVEGVSSLETSYGIVSGGSGVTVGVPTAFPNNNNRLINNLVRQCNTGIAIIGNNGTDFNWRITNNIVGSMVPAEIVGAHGISAVNVSGLQVSNNNIIGLQADVTQAVTGIDIGQAAVNTQIFNNRIHDIENLEETTGYGAVGIYFGPSVSNNNRIYNNQIHSIRTYGHSPADPFAADNNAYGIAIATEDGYAVYHNTVYMNIAPVDPVGGNSAALYIGGGVLPGVGAINLRNNILSNTIQAPGAHYSVYSAIGAVLAESDYNLYNAPGDLCYMGAAATNLADWKTLTLDDKGSVSGTIALVLIADAVMVDPTNPNSWLANGRSIAIANYSTDINGTARNPTPGYPSDMGAAEYTPDILALPPFAVASAAPAPSTTTTYSVGNRKVAEIEWGPGGTVPTTVNLQYYSGIEPLNYIPTDERIASYFDLAQLGGVGFTARVKFYYTYAENRGVPDAALQVVKDTVGNGAWSNFGGAASTDADGRFVEWSNFMSTFGYFTLGNHPLGLDLLTFTGKNIGAANEVAWTTASEDDMDNFEVMRSDDGINFKVIGSVKATNKPISNQYKFIDSKPVAGSNYYKLKINDLNGYSQYSDIVAVRSGAVTNIDITSLYPNPATSTISVALNSVGDNAVNVQVTDITGKTMITQNSAVVAGSNEVKLNVSELASGIYMIKATLPDGTVSIQKFVKQ